MTNDNHASDPFDDLCERFAPTDRDKIQILYQVIAAFPEGVDGERARKLANKVSAWILQTRIDAPIQELILKGLISVDPTHRSREKWKFRPIPPEAARVITEEMAASINENTEE